MAKDKGSHALTVPDDVMSDLLRAQAEQSGVGRLPDVKVMAAGAGLFEFKDTGDTAREFYGVILNTHPNNILWDKKYGSDAPSGVDPDEWKLPACVANDGVRGLVRPGFKHLGLAGNAQARTQREATVAGVAGDTVDCVTCPYNKWGSAPVIEVEGKGGKGKAVTNQRTLYILTGERAAPVALTLPPTSLTDYGRYAQTLTNQGTLMLSVVTKFTQRIGNPTGAKYGIVEMRVHEHLSQDAFDTALSKRTQYLELIQPPMSASFNDAASWESDEDDDSALPF